ncbi:5-(carboxyamino)imidazole ribonucleotide synthase [Legionella maceachernii]|uniref:N5-carboxyaminoimidazole ribonucleotide synthase n=2 Tax=Legionella TaxID=445 RepID=A0A0W0VXX8_9GAMM|nr:5-(carboxyamino)imidazole ribonucleotide synthase [Legionella maceachernii]KTD24890.1 phosphoribosylaminoimidazole carboxylase ATPase subunit [Legionella maceachernii]SKA16015.1 5-(carboxyamino)imidazole ribonucleotide synthase [Legionella maceachernii]SUP01582.1 N5-carboxyaminoimidazole ribonucleotide synthase [Legionella maceachernii]
MKIGILGGGQLARMLSMSAHTLGIKTLCLDPNQEACAENVTLVLRGEYSDKNVLKQFLESVDCVTLETENIPLDAVEFINSIKPVYPSIHALKISQDRYLEKSFLKSLGIATAEFTEINTMKQLEAAIAEIGLPAILKTRRMGYDGKGQFLIRHHSELPLAWQELQQQPLILEKFIPFHYEVSLIAVRNKKSNIEYYPLIRNHHKNGILRWSEAPFKNEILEEECRRITKTILDELNYVGVITVEFFYDGHKLMVNEIAPRVHNSGHLTIEGAATSQFENHLRAIFDLPLGSTSFLGNCFLLNFIGEMLPIQNCLKYAGLHYHDYEKAPRLNRKVGHATLVSWQTSRYDKTKQELKSFLGISEDG